MQDILNILFSSLPGVLVALAGTLFNFVYFKYQEKERFKYEQQKIRIQTAFQYFLPEFKDLVTRIQDLRIDLGIACAAGIVMNPTKLHKKGRKLCRSLEKSPLLLIVDEPLIETIKRTAIGIASWVHEKGTLVLEPTLGEDPKYRAFNCNPDELAKHSKSLETYITELRLILQEGQG